MDLCPALLTEFRTRSQTMSTDGAVRIGEPRGVICGQWSIVRCPRKLLSRRNAICRKDFIVVICLPRREGPSPNLIFQNDSAILFHLLVRKVHSLLCFQHCSPQSQRRTTNRGRPTKEPIRARRKHRLLEVGRNRRLWTSHVNHELLET